METGKPKRSLIFDYTVEYKTKDKIHSFILKIRKNTLETEMIRNIIWVTFGEELKSFLHHYVEKWENMAG